MGEYDRKQRNKLSRATANNESGSRQLKRFVDDRRFSYLTIQRMTQDEIERHYISHMSGGLHDENWYGGLCGGWTANFLENPGNALKLWGEMQEDKNEGRFDKLEAFKKIMKYHHYMSIADGETDFGNLDENELRGQDIDISDKTSKKQKFKNYVGRDSDRIESDKKGDIVQAVCSSIASLQEESSLYIGSPGHHMAIWRRKGKTKKYVVCETNNLGIENVGPRDILDIFNAIDWETDIQGVFRCWIRRVE